MIAHARAGKGPALVRLTVPRLSGHSGQDTQAYKGAELLERERAGDPLPKLKTWLADGVLSAAEMAEIESRAESDIQQALAAALARPEADIRPA